LFDGELFQTFGEWPYHKCDAGKDQYRRPVNIFIDRRELETHLRHQEPEPCREKEQAENQIEIQEIENSEKDKQHFPSKIVGERPYPEQINLCSYHYQAKRDEQLGYTVKGIVLFFHDCKIL